MPPSYFLEMRRVNSPYYEVTGFNFKANIEILALNMKMWRRMIIWPNYDTQIVYSIH